MGIVTKEKKETNGIVIENLFHDSKSLLKTSYNYNTKQLIATFIKGTAYGYNNVPTDIYEGLKTASSTGSYFNTQIVKKYPATLIGTVDQDNLIILKDLINENKNK